MNWEDRKEVRKGNIGERILRELFEVDGYICYRVITDGPHLIDYFLHKEDKEIMAAEIKTKRRRAKYPDTGVNTRNFREYERLADNHNMRIKIIFVDDHERAIYGEWFDELRKFAYEHGAQTYFPLDKMEFVRKLTDAEVEELKKYTTENYDYTSVPKFFETNKTLPIEF
jgi:hypothetical protein